MKTGDKLFSHTTLLFKSDQTDPQHSRHLRISEMTGRHCEGVTSASCASQVLVWKCCSPLECCAQMVRHLSTHYQTTIKDLLQKHMSNMCIASSMHILDTSKVTRGLISERIHHEQKRLSRNKLQPKCQHRSSCYGDSWLCA